MSGKSNIEWTDATWNPIVGCSIVSPGCTNCYAMRMAARLELMGNAPHYAGLAKKVNGTAVWTGKLALAPEKTLTEPLRRRRPSMYFVNSMGDLFHEDCPDEWIDRVFRTMGACDDLGCRHTFQILTKRAGRMLTYMTSPRARTAWNAPPMAPNAWPPRNIWLGVSAERQQEADERIPLLLGAPAAVRFVSCEPLLGPIKFHEHLGDDWLASGLSGERRGLDWIIVGGESGPDARPFQIEWAERIVAQCAAADVACFVKQLGAVPLSSGYPLALKSRKGGDPQEWPDSLRVREFPHVPTRAAA